MSRYYTLRCYGHNYYAPFIYHIILNKKEGFPSFGTVGGDASIPPGEKGCAYIRRSDYGQKMATALARWQKEYPFIKVWRYMVMPDHLHLLINIAMHTEKHLSYYITTLKYTAAKLMAPIAGRDLNPSDVFMENFCDKPLFRERSLKALIAYIDENPHRLAMRFQHPEFFQRKRNLQIDNRQVEAYGNLFLLKNPDKLAVKISRRFKAEEVERLRKSWLTEACKGSVLVSPFIHPKENEILKEAISGNCAIILIRHEEFGEKFKPSKELFRLCSEGRLLIISIGRSLGADLTREDCAEMNGLASDLAGMQ